MDKKKNDFLGKRIKYLREREGLSQEELSEKLSLKRSTISQIENGSRLVRVTELQEIAKTFNLTIEQLLDASQEIDVILENPKPTANRSNLRILVSRENVDKFKEVLLYILWRVGSRQIGRAHV